MTIYRVYIYLANAEWGNEIMRKVADDYARHCDHRPLIVSVHEHGGWHLSYLHGAPDIVDGTICGTANDAAALDPAVVEYGKGIGSVEILPEIRR